MEISIPIPAGLSTYTWRSIRPNDLSGIYKMLMANSGVDKPDTPPSKEHLRLLLGMLGGQIDQNTRLALTKNGTVAAAALIFIPAGEEEQVALVEGMVHVDHRGRGIGSYLLQWIEARVRQAFGDPEDGRPQLIRTSCVVHQEDRIRLFEQQGFSAARYSYKMWRSLSQPILETRLPGSLRWVQWTPELDLPLMIAFNEAFREHYGVQEMNAESWRQLFTGVPQFRGDLTSIVMDGEEIIGFCINWVEGTGQDDPSSQEGWVEAIGVIPTWRGQGVASALLGHALSQFQTEGFKHAALEVDAENPSGALRLYEKHGFKAVRETIHFVKILN